MTEYDIRSEMHVLNQNSGAVAYFVRYVITNVCQYIVDTQKKTDEIKTLCKKYGTEVGSNDSNEELCFKLFSKYKYAWEEAEDEDKKRKIQRNLAILLGNLRKRTKRETEAATRSLRPEAAEADLRGDEHARQQVDQAGTYGQPVNALATTARVREAEEQREQEVMETGKETGKIERQEDSKLELDTDTNVLREGKVKKWATFRYRWDDRYLQFVHIKSRGHYELRWYTSEQECKSGSAPRGTMIIDSQANVTSSPTTKEFTVVRGETTKRFSTDDYDDYEGWVEAIDNIIAVSRREPAQVSQSANGRRR